MEKKESIENTAVHWASHYLPPRLLRMDFLPCGHDGYGHNGYYSDYRSLYP